MNRQKCDLQNKFTIETQLMQKEMKRKDLEIDDLKDKVEHKAREFEDLLQELKKNFEGEKQELIQKLELEKQNNIVQQRLTTEVIEENNNLDKRLSQIERTEKINQESKMLENMFSCKQPTEDSVDEINMNEMILGAK